MKKEEIFEILMQAESADIAPLASEYRKTVPYTVIKPPQQELIMFQAEESVEKIDFNVGEILVTSAEVRVNDSIGYSMIMDLDEDKALDCALIMGVYEAALPQHPVIEEMVRALAAKSNAILQEEREIVGSTVVNFELMGGQDPNVKHNANEDDSDV